MDNTQQFVAVVLAADRTGHDPITQHTGATCKAIAPVAGRPMIMRVLDALEASDLVKSIILCGPPEHILPDCPELEQRIADGRVTWLPNLDSPSKSAMKGFEQVGADTPLFLTTADHALLTSQIVQHFLSESLKSNGDTTVGLVNIDDVTAAFPGAKRTITKFRDGGYCGCNLYTFNHRGREIVSIWRQAEAMRKRPWRLIAQILGPWTVLKYLLGRLTLEQAFNAVSVKTGIHAQAIILPFPEAGVDVDKVDDLLLAESILTNNEINMYKKRVKPFL